MKSPSSLFLQIAPIRRSLGEAISTNRCEYANGLIWEGDKTIAFLLRRSRARKTMRNRFPGVSPSLYLAISFDAAHYDVSSREYSHGFVFLRRNAIAAYLNRSIDGRRLSNTLMRRFDSPLRRLCTLAPHGSPGLQNHVIRINE